VARSFVLAALLLVGCGGRPIPFSDALLADGSRASEAGGRDARADALAPAHEARADRAAPGFCSGGGAKVMLGGATLTATSIESGTTITECCDGEIVTVHATDAAGQPVSITFMLLRFPKSTLPSHLDLAALPPGITIGVRCSPYGACGSHDVERSTFEGYADLTSTSAFPGYQLTLCLAASPNAPTTPPAQPVRIWASSVTIHTACTHGVEQSCNDSPLVSAIYGHCAADGTCVCNPGHPLNPASGRCL